MKRFRITNTQSGVDLGTYEAIDPRHALDVYAQDAGYLDYDTALQALPILPVGEICVEEVED